MKSASKKDKGAVTDDVAAKAEPKKKATVAKRAAASTVASPKVAVGKKTVKATAKSKATPSAEVPTSMAAEPKVKKAAPSKAKAAKSSAAAETVIIAKIDAGLGNIVYVRGDGAGLSWEKGVPAKCVADDKWELKLKGAKAVVHCKFLLNDEIWCEGPDLPAMPGEATTFNPAFG